jgi:1-acyl-sn-glycerol-3-phosphate acyltransferase
MELTERPVQLRGSAFARLIMRAFGWRLCFDGLPARQGVIIVYPHTSNWDFVVGMVAKWAAGLPVAFWGKDTLFRVPLFGRWVRWLGGLPVDRSSSHGVVGQMARELAAARRDGRFLWVALSPEGTRRYTEGWRSGFFHLATQAQVPLGLATFDYRRRVIGIEHFLLLGGDPATDMAEIVRVLGHPEGRHPELAAPIRLKP